MEWDSSPVLGEIFWALNACLKAAVECQMPKGVYIANNIFWALNSVVECLVYIEEVIGSNPIAPTITLLYIPFSVKLNK